MKLTALITLTLLVSGCGIGISNNAICDATRETRSAHAEALLEDAGDASVVTGALLIRQIDNACKR